MPTSKAPLSASDPTDEEEQSQREDQIYYRTALAYKVNMDVCKEWGIFIPEEAEVQSIPLQSLPPSVLKRMGLPLPDCDPSRRTTDLDTVTWICPAFVSKAGLKSSPPTGTGGAEGVRALMQFGSRLAPLKMSFISSNRVALEVLKDISHKPHTRPLPQGTSPTTDQTAVVIYRGQVYLCIRKSELSLKQQKKSSTPSSLSTDSRVTENVTESSCQTKASRGEVWSPLKKSCAALRREMVSPDSCSVKRVSMEQAGLEGGAVQETHGGGTSSSSAGHEAAAFSEQTRSWKEPAGVPASAVALRPQFDFRELEEEEKIAQMKARYLKDEAALNNLLSGP